jgi:predicted negative regulator of RcsB-dependent stress response
MVKKQILEFVLKNWKAILIVLLLVVVAMKSRRDYQLMQKAYETQAESYEAQIEGLKQIHLQEIQEKQRLMESYLESIAAIEEEYEQSIKMLDDVK